ncbi:glycosyltransferase [Sediminitomix flava]|uniref:Glycosyltransferase involved in cell wall biosynthesis n=1 Tax=Sediminitomix flava TaxID=379075 RepID=A0A315Z792_SEDFL|nr:glycosyltransferase [Sediminitomix flava]PWJ40822.1 glycosyltransferase involved in cell wall biosynthesis [Sediminitomix flava]
MKILHINTSDQHGGAENIAYSLMQEFGGKMLVKIKHRTDSNIKTFKRSLISYFLEGIDSILYRAFKRTIFSDFGVLYDIHGTWKFLKNNLWYTEADCIFIHNVHGGYFDLKTLEKISEEKKVIWVLHDMWCMTGGEAHTMENKNFKNGNSNTPFNKIYPLKHPILDFRSQFLKRKKNIYQNSPKIVFVAVSKWIAKDFKESFTAHSNIDIRVIRNGIDTEVFFNLNQRISEQTSLLFFNSPNPFKGSDLVRKVASKINGDFKLITVGDKVEGIENQELIRPTYNPIEMNKIYNKADVLIFPSKMEALGLVALEGMAAGMYVVGSDTGGSKEVIDENNGLTFKNNDADSLNETIDQCLKIPIEQLRELGYENAENIRKSWSKDQMIEAYQQLLL